MKSSIRIVAVIMLILAAAAVPALADDKPAEGYFQGGYSAPISTASDYVNGGWMLSGGVILHPAPAKPFGVRFDLGYNYWSAKQALINLGQSQNIRTDDGDATMWSLTADGLWHFGHKSGEGIGGYVGVGIGGYRQYVQLTQTALQSGYICDPWWGYCYPGVVSGQVISASTSTIKFGYNGALGIDFPVGNGSLYIEARWHHVNTGTPTQYVPIVLGYKF